MFKLTTQFVFATSKRSILLALTCLAVNACSIPFIHHTNNRGANQTTPLNVAVTTHLGDHARFIKGDEIQFLLSTNQSCYALLLYRDASNRLWQLFPNRMSGSQKLPAGDYMTFPVTGTGIRITVGPPYGEEQVVLYASNKPLPELAFRQSNNGLRQLKNNLSEVESTVRKHSKDVHAEITLATNTLTTSKR